MESIDDRAMKRRSRIRGGFTLIELLNRAASRKQIPISLSPDPNGPDFETVLAACRRIVDAGRKVCFQIGYEENRIRQIFAALPPESCLFYLSGAKDLQESEQFLQGIEKLTRTTGWRMQ